MFVYQRVFDSWLGIYMWDIMRICWDMDNMERQMLNDIFWASVLGNTQINVAIATHLVKGQSVCWLLSQTR